MARRKAADTAEKQSSLFQTPEPPDLLRKAVQAIHIAPKSGKLGLQQRKMFSSLIKNAIAQDKGEPGVESFSIGIGALSLDSGLNSNNTAYVKEQVNSLISTVVNWDYLAEDRSTSWKASGLIAGAELRAGVLFYSFSPQLRRELLNPDVFALIDMRIARDFTRSHSLALWENTVRYERVGLTGKIPLDKFRDLILGQGKQSYQQYKLFKSKVLLPCMREVNERSDHELELIEHKVGRSVSAVQFKVKRKEVADVVDLVDGRADGVIDDILKFGIPRTEAKKMIAQYGDQRVKAAVAYTMHRIGKKGATPIDNPAKYFRNALSHGYTLASVDVSGAAPNRVPAQQLQAELRDRYVARQISEARSYFGELAIDEQNALIDRYNETVEASNLRLAPPKKPTKLAETNFFRWLALDTWGEPTEGDLLAFLLEQASAGAAQ
ncbi:replication initiation protein [Burkholderia gladioli]|uniref:replication initiation protein n=1 Tax=Burkholderia gladioli TaxID=28095 RepID=UPI0016405080|nr:replication initiation protein [Burkholderia gladioli]